MRLAFLLFLAMPNTAKSQQVAFQKPDIHLAAYNVVYKLCDNLIYIDCLAGSKVSVSGGKLSKTKGQCLYQLRPDSLKNQVIIVVQKGKQRQTKTFESRFLPERNFEIMSFLERYPDGYIPFGHNSNPRAGKGIFVTLSDFPFQPTLKVESFIVSRIVGDSTEQHRNIGEEFDSTVLDWIQNGKSTSTLTIKYVRISSGGGAWTIFQKEYPIYLP